MGTVEAISQIPIGSNNDVAIWNATTHGEFIVRSAYHLQHELILLNKEECSRTGQQSSMWKQIWNMNTPNVVMVFMWRACRNALATKANLF